MFDTSYQQTLRGRKGTTGKEARSRRRFWIVVLVASITGAAVLSAGCLLLLGRPSIEEGLADMENDIGRDMLELSIASASRGLKMIPQIKDKAEKWAGGLDRLGDFRRRDQDIDRAQKLRPLIRKAEKWESALSSVPPGARAEIWQRLKFEIAAEAQSWPVVAVPERPRRLFNWRFLFEGAQLGALWPAGLVRRGTFVANRGLRGVSGLSSQQALRYIFHPYGKWSFEMTHLLGFGLAALAVGYLLCWIGMRVNVACISYLGVAYFLYIVFFATMFLSLGLLQ